MKSAHGKGDTHHTDEVRQDIVMQTGEGVKNPSISQTSYVRVPSPRFAVLRRTRESRRSRRRPGRHLHRRSFIKRSITKWEDFVQGDPSTGLVKTSC